MRWSPRRVLDTLTHGEARFLMRAISAVRTQRAMTQVSVASILAMGTHRQRRDLSESAGIPQPPPGESPEDRAGFERARDLLRMMRWKGGSPRGV